MLDFYIETTANKPDKTEHTAHTKMKIAITREIFKRKKAMMKRKQVYHSSSVEEWTQEKKEMLLKMNPYASTAPETAKGRTVRFQCIGVDLAE